MSSDTKFPNPSLLDDVTDHQGSVIPHAASQPGVTSTPDDLSALAAGGKNSRPKRAAGKTAPKPVTAAGAMRKTTDGRGEPAYLSVRQVAKRYSVSVASIWRWVKNVDGFPKPIELTPGTTRWAVADLLIFEQRRREI